GVAAEGRTQLPGAGEYGVGMVFLPTDAQDRAACEGLFEQVVREEGQVPLGWRTVPTYGAMLGNTARQSQPVVRQIFIGHRPSPPTPLPVNGERGDNSSPLSPLAGRGVGGEGSDLDFERKLYVIRRRIENAV